MAALTTSAVTVLEAWQEGGLNGKRHVAKRVTLALTGQGGTVNTIGAAVFGFNRIVEASLAVDDTGGDIYEAVPSRDGLLLYLLDPSNAANAAMDITDTVTLVVKGIA